MTKDILKKAFEAGMQRAVWEEYTTGNEPEEPDFETWYAAFTETKKPEPKKCEHRGILIYKNMTPLRCWNCGELIHEFTPKPKRNGTN